ncbi:telomerase reverse transcriptase-like [Macrobrachium nipponense]|uniref:telomerase reverse transcriptase-like n=1 Tax=Macrobrachium nipponense TaxID=159736 RepID=UPI0030C82C78
MMDDRLGYVPSHEVKKTFFGVSNLSSSHVFEDYKDNDGLQKIFSEINSIKVGIDMPEIDLQKTPLVSIFEKMRKNLKTIHFPSLLVNCMATTKNKKYKEKIKVEGKEIRSLVMQDPEEDDMINIELDGRSLQLYKNQLEWCYIYRFIVRVLHFLLPMEIWGHSKNFKVIRQKIKYILRSGCRDVIYLGNILQNLKISSFKWAAPFESYFMKTHIISKVIVWVIEKLAFTLIRKYFHVTEGKTTRYQMIFYHISSWRSIHESGISTLVNKGSLKLLNRAAAVKIAECQSKFGNYSCPSKIRFIPKLNGVRPIVKSQNVGASKVLLLKQRLLLVEFSSFFEVGVSIKSTKCFTKAWEDYVKVVRSLKENVYIVKVDITDAYGSVLHSKLQEIIGNCRRTFPKKIYFDQYVEYHGPFTKTNKKVYVRLDENHQPTSPLVRNSHKLVKCGDTIEIDTEKVGDSLEILIRGQVVRLGVKRYSLKKGLPQGGYLSAFLCDLYYSNLCHDYLESFVNKTSYLLRSVDDILYVTTSFEKAESFLGLMNNGMNDFNVSINSSKTKHNLIGPTRIYFDGAMICTKTLQVLVDVTAVVTSYPRFTIKVNRYKNPGKLFADRVRQVTFARLKGMVINPVYTNISGLISNVWRTSLMTGARISALMDALLKPRKLPNIKFICKTVVSVSKKIWSKIRGTWRETKEIKEIRSELLRVVFIGGILSIWRLPNFPAHPKIYSVLYRHMVHLLKVLPEEYHCRLPLFCRNALRMLRTE